MVGKRQKEHDTKHVNMASFIQEYTFSVKHQYGIVDVLSKEIVVSYHVNH